MGGAFQTTRYNIRLLLKRLFVLNSLTSIFCSRHFSLSFSSLRDFFFFFFFRSWRQSSGEREFLWSRSQTGGISPAIDKSIEDRVSWSHTFPLGTTLGLYSPLLPPFLALSIVTSFSAVMASAVGVSRLWWAGPTPDGQTKKSLLNWNTLGHFKFLCPIIPRRRRQHSLYLCEDTLSLVSSSTFSCSSSLHCRPSSSEWTLMTSLITCSDQNIDNINFI